MGSTIDQVWLKMARANEHLEALHLLCQRHCESDFYRIAHQVDRDGHPIVRVIEVKPFPPACSILIGEVAQQFRSVLDHLIFACAKPAHRKAEDRVKFPISSTSKRFADAKNGAMPGVPDEIVRYVKSVQPYHRRKEPRGKLLLQLQAIDNWNKHRALTVAAASIVENTTSFHVSAGTANITEVRHFGGRIKRNKVLARIESGYFGAGAEINANPKLSLLPVFDVRSPREVKGLPVTHLLPDVGNFIAGEIIPFFERRE